MSSVLAGARELMHQQHFLEVIAACQTALGIAPKHLELRLLLAESLMSLQRDVEAQEEVAAALRENPRCPQAFRLLGELAFRRDELRAAEIFLREALRVAPDDRCSSDLLEMVKLRKTPAAAAAKLPAASAAAGTSSVPHSTRARLRARGTESEPVHEPHQHHEPQARNVPELILAAGSGSTGTDATAVELTGSVDVDLDMDMDTGVDFDSDTTSDGTPTLDDDSLLEDGATAELPRPDLGHLLSVADKKPWVRPVTDHGEATVCNAALPGRSASVALRLDSGVVGFGEYLVLTGALTRWQLYRVLQVQDWQHVRLGEAAVSLGYISAARVESLLRRYLTALSDTSSESELRTAV